MKVLFAVITISLFAQAHAAKLSCPGNSKTVMTCTKADAPGDYQFALNFMDGAIVCQDSRNAYGVILSTFDGVSPLFTVKLTSRVGATTFDWREDGVSFSLSKSSGRGDNGKFTIVLGGNPAFRTLKCK